MQDNATNVPAIPVDQSALFQALENIKVLEKKINLVDSIEYKVGKPFGYSRFAKAPDLVQIPECQNVQILHEVLGFIIQKTEYYEKAHELSGYDSIPVGKWLGIPLQHWKEDLLLRLTVLDKENQLSAIAKDKEFIESKIDPAIVDKQKTDEVLGKYLKGE